MVLPGNDRFKIVNDHIEQCLVSIHGDLPEQGSAEFVLQDVVKLDTHQFIVVEGYELSTIHPSVRLSVCPYVRMSDKVGPLSWLCSKRQSAKKADRQKSVRFLGFVPRQVDSRYALLRISRYRCPSLWVETLGK
jgi:hypothetical protein